MKEILYEAKEWIMEYAECDEEVIDAFIDKVLELSTGDDYEDDE